MKQPLVFPQDVPHESVSGKYIRYGGMTLRDYFAGQIMAKVASIPLPGPYEPEIMARTCYQLADAMIAERDRKDRESGKVG